FGDFGSALIISCHEDGTVFGCEVAHAAHAKRAFSASGTIEMTEFQIAGGQVQGQLSTGGETKAFDQTWEVNLKFAAPFAGQPKLTDTKKSAKDSPAIAQNAEPSNRKRPRSEATDRAAEVPKKATPKLNVKELAILQGV